MANSISSPKFHEYKQLELLIEKQRAVQSPYWNFEITSTVYHKNTEYPLWKVTCENQQTSPSKEKSTLIITGGVHGLERIGSQLCVSLIEKYFELSQWDTSFQNKLQSLRLVFIPFVNPAGIQERTRSNPQGIDLMRNSTIESHEKVPFLIGGHRFSSHLPWYRGKVDNSFEQESLNLINEVTKEVLKSKFCISVDIHSGFGFKDQIWFPWAFTKKPFPRLDYITLMMEYFEKLYPFHIYKIEPQSKVYCTHGDLWDYIAHDKIKDTHFIPLTLELGSWLWIKKNPLQLFNSEGLFNPIKKHRVKRTMRRHQLLVDFLMRFILFSETEQFRKINLIEYYNKGLKKWYPQHKEIGS